MSEKEQDTFLGAALREREEARKRLACNRVKASKVIEALRAAAACLEAEEDSCYAKDIAGCPSKETVEDLFGSIRKETNIIATLDEQLQSMLPSLQLS